MSVGHLVVELWGSFDGVEYNGCQPQFPSSANSVHDLCNELITPLMNARVTYNFSH